MSMKAAMLNKLGDVAGDVLQRAKDLIPKKRIQDEIERFQRVYGTGFKNNLFLLTFHFPGGDGLKQIVAQNVNAKYLRYYSNITTDPSLGTMLQEKSGQLLSKIPGTDLTKSLLGGYLQKRGAGMSASGFYWYGFAKNVRLPAQAISAVTAYSSMNLPVTKDRQNFVTSLYDDQQSVGYHFWRTVQDFMFESTTLQMHYFNEYRCNIHVDILDTQHSNMYTYVFYNAFPNGLPDMGLESDGGKSPVTFDLTFSYDSFTFKYWDKPSLSDVAKTLGPAGALVGKGLEALSPPIDPEEQSFVVAAAIGNGLMNATSIAANARYNAPVDQQELQSRQFYNEQYVGEGGTIVPDRMLLTPGVKLPKTEAKENPIDEVEILAAKGISPIALNIQQVKLPTALTTPDQNLSDFNSLQTVRDGLPVAVDEPEKSYDDSLALVKQQKKNPTATIEYSAFASSGQADRDSAAVMSNINRNTAVGGKVTNALKQQMDKTQINSPDKNKVPASIFDNIAYSTPPTHGV